MPPANSAPVRPERCARRAMRLSSAPASAETVLSSFTRTSSSSDVQTTAPRMPASATSMLEPLPSSRNGILRSRSTASAAVSSLRVFGCTNRSAGPPMANVVWRRMSSFSAISISGAASRSAAMQSLICSIRRLILYKKFKWYTLGIPAASCGGASKVRHREQAPVCPAVPFWFLLYCLL